MSLSANNKTASTIIKSKSIVDGIEQRIKSMITSGLLNPGDPIPSERELQEQFGVSRLPLREALARLQALGLIRIRHGKGAFVEDVVSVSALSDVLIPFFPGRNSKRLSELVEARSLLEGELTRLTTQRAKKDDIARLEQWVRPNQEAIKDAEVLADVDYAFHHEIARTARNSFLFLMHEAIGSHIRSFITNFAETEKLRRAALKRNRDLVRAIKAGDPESAAQMARDHLQPCLKSMSLTSDR